jgi:diguanylate cyclase (GGDEF)-like protein
VTAAADTVLIVEDEAPMRRFLSAALHSHGFRVIEAGTLAAAERLATESVPSAILLDLGLPDGDGLTFVRSLRTWSAAPVIVLSARDREDDKVTALDAGADDYMVKPVHVEELRARVHVGLRVVMLQESLAARVAELGAAHDHLAKLASTDALTGLYSRRGWFDLTAAEFSRCRRYGRTFSLLVADLDWFKRVNDTHGHDAGDRLLRAFADMLRSECRRSDIIGRIGGEEFVVALPETGALDAQAIAARLTERCRALAVRSAAGEIRCSCSIGVTELRAADEDVESVLRRADTALYEAKRNGRDRWRLAA